MTAAPNSDESVSDYPPGTPGASDFTVRLSHLDGIWTLSFGQFGWNDYDGRGAVVQIEQGECSEAAAISSVAAGAPSRTAR